MAQHAHKRFLHRVFGIGGVAKNGKGYAIESSGVLAHQGRKRRFFGPSPFRLSAGFIAHSAVWNLHPTCENCLAGAHKPPDAGGKENARGPERI